MDAQSREAGNFPVTGEENPFLRPVFPCPRRTGNLLKTAAADA
jgi:hypothetical protein